MRLLNRTLQNHLRDKYEKTLNFEQYVKKPCKLWLWENPAMNIWR